MQYRPTPNLSEVQTRAAGITTFMKLPHTRDLTGVDVAVVGVPFDCGGAIRVGARFGPGAIRQQSKLYLRRHHRTFGFSPFEILKAVDYGDTPIIQEMIETSFDLITNDILPIVLAGAVPFALGGDHAVSLPLLRAVAKRHQPIALVHFDAHQDVVDSYYGGRVRYNNGTVFRRAVEEGLIDPHRSIQIGMNGTVFPGMRPQDSEALGFKVVPIEEVDSLGPKGVAEAVHARVGRSKVYLSFDIDAMDASVAPGSGAPEVGGLMPRETFAMLRGLAGLDIVGADLVEVNPLCDAADMTSILAANLCFELITLIAISERARREAAS